MNQYARKILDTLLNSFEKSRTFTGDNLVKQTFSVKPVKIFPEYADSAEFDVFKAVNETAAQLESKNFVIIKRQKNNVIVSISLNIAAVSEIYAFLGRTPKKDTNARLTQTLQSYIGCNDILDCYCREQLKRLSENKKIPQFDGDFQTFHNLLEVLANIMSIQKETFQRDFSSTILHDSKAFEKIKSKVVNILFEYGDFAEKETVLEELNIIRNPGHVYFKGNCIITISGQQIDLQKLNGDIGISSSLLDSIEDIQVQCRKVITIENLTTFNAFSDKDFFVIYLGGYHNHDRGEFIRKIYRLNPCAEYYHFGDIDAGGFYILLHLRKKTGVLFQPYKMDTSTLKNCMKKTKKLTDNDRTRLKNLLETEFQETVTFMLEHDCKLEQENLDE